MNTKYKVISIFSGIGGSSQGYKQAGFDVIAAVEFLDYQATNYRLNHPDTKLYECDIRTLDPLQVLNDLKLKVRELDVLDGSPPCSSFSTNGVSSALWGKSHSYGNVSQRTDDLFAEYVRFLDKMKPKVFVAENVSGLIKGVSKGQFNEIIRLFKSCGYNAKAKLLNAANYGVPQKRERVIFIGVRNDLYLSPVFPEPNIKKIVCKDVLNNIEVDKNEDVSTSELSIKYWNNTKPGGDFSDAAELMTGKAKRFSCKRLNPYDAACTITAACFKDIFHYNEPRVLYSEELKALQTFSKDFKVIGKSRRDKCEGIGRAVPPKMMEAIARTIKTEILDVLTFRLNRILSDVTEL